EVCVTCDLRSLELCLSFCFFFQAEDGIRESSVSGVQTCALRICVCVCVCVCVISPMHMLHLHEVYLVFVCSGMGQTWTTAESHAPLCYSREGTTGVGVWGRGCA